MKITRHDKTVVFSEDEIRVIRFFLESAFRTLDEIIRDRLVHPDFVFPGITDIDEKVLKETLRKLSEITINVYDLPIKNLPKENEFEFDL